MSLEKKGSAMSKFASKHSTLGKLTSRTSTTSSKTEPVSQLDKDEKLFLYACDGNLPKVDKWLFVGANIHARIALGRTPIIGAAANGNEQVVKYLIQHGSNVNDQDNSGMTALMLAMIHGFSWIVELLLQCGANSRFKNKNGKTAWDYASGSSYMKDLLAQYDGANAQTQPKHVGSVLRPFDNRYDLSPQADSMERQQSRNRNALEENSYSHSYTCGNSFVMGSLGW
eukprot:CAMPEP_0184691300 /NCGR_PEP_ID=MMETSP0313-20130426/196_1 /TAXON_ID=2792 /ORGANISM="Porphyridium aerugineum, Strain SAG 1380-2" /LENGTH=226 /DNA_ID=CAMNT_0027148987 /DNA_START=139 /DNA_END=822 /DNA_ORIENTATION=-